MEVIALGLLVGVPVARGQLQGKISMAKEEYLAGEPIYVHFEVTNVGNEAVQYQAGDPYGDACGGYSIEVLNGRGAGHASCEPGGSSECIVANQMLAPGETDRRNILVNFAHDVTKAGDYEIHVVRTLRYLPVTGETQNPADAKEFKYEQRLPIRVAVGNRGRLEAIYRVYVTNLGSTDDEIQRDAERAIVSGAPPWLEDAIIGMLRKSTSREFALLGLKNLNTARSREELAKIVKSTSEQTPENEAAVGYLGQMRDKAYFPMLLEAAKRVPANEGQEYVLAAAELGGEDALAYLRGLLESQDRFARANATIGLGKTGSRGAVGILIGTLKNKEDDGLRKLAENALTELTHRAGDAGEWQAWWVAEGKSARIYGPRECGEVRGLL
jgi:HEAT repeats